MLPDNSNNMVQPAPGNETEYNTIRKKMQQEMEALKKQVLSIQQQSLSVMQQSVQSLFTTQAAESIQQLTQQEEEINKELISEIKETDKINSSAAKAVNEEKKDIDTKTTAGAASMHAQYNAALLAVAAAQQSVDNAMKAALASVQAAEDILKSIG